MGIDTAIQALVALEKPLGFIAGGVAGGVGGVLVAVKFVVDADAKLEKLFDIGKRIASHIRKLPSVDPEPDPTPPAAAYKRVRRFTTDANGKLVRNLPHHDGGPRSVLGWLDVVCTIARSTYIRAALLVLCYRMDRGNIGVARDVDCKAKAAATVFALPAGTICIALCETLRHRLGDLASLLDPPPLLMAVWPQLKRLRRRSCESVGLRERRMDWHQPCWA